MRFRLDPFSPSGVSVETETTRVIQSQGYVTDKITGLLTAGTNVTLGGTGTKSDPYVVNSSGSGGGGGSWGSITGTLSSQTDLQTALTARVLKAGDTMTGTFNSQTITPTTTATYTLGDATHYYTTLYTTRNYFNSTAYIDGATAGVLTLTNKVNMGTTQTVYLPDQTNFAGSSFYGDGGSSLSHTTGGEGQGNTALGVGAGFSVTTGLQNISVGNEAGYRGTTASNNFAIGYKALHENVVGGNNLAIGIFALFANTASFNLALGYNALGSNVGGSANIGIGTETLQNTTASDNTGVGFGAFHYGNSGSNNVGVGKEVFRNGAVTNSVGIGKEAGIDSNGSNNVFVGYQAGFTENTGNGNVFLGYQAGYSETGSNKLYISNSNTATPLIGGDFSTGAVTFSGVAVPTVSSTSTLTNKTISGASNTLSAIPESAVTNLVTDLAAKDALMTVTALKTANYTLAANEFVPVDTTSGNITLTLPTAPANGTRIGTKQVIQGGTNTITITAGGSDVFNKAGGNTSVTVSLLNQGVQYQYSSGIWYGVAGDIGTTALDARYMRSSIGLSGYISAGTNVSFTGSGTVAAPYVISATGGSGSSFAFSEVTGTTQAAVINTGYITNNAGLVTVTLPSTAVQGSMIRVIGKGAGGWKLAQNASQAVYFGNATTTTGTGGSLASTHRRDTINIVCITADTEWQVVNSVGNITVV